MRIDTGQRRMKEDRVACNNAVYSLTNNLNSKYASLHKKILSLGFSEENIPTLQLYLDKLSNIIIDSYISSKQKKL